MTKFPSELEVANYLYANTHDDADGCWIWDGPMGTVGYGQTKFRNPSRGPEFAHRLAFTTWVRSLARGEYVLHHCDKKACINPDHLWPGTQKDNIRDAIAKGRFVNPPLMRGENQCLHKLRESDIPVIRRRLTNGESCELVARDYGVCSSTIGHVGTRHTWGWVPEVGMTA